MNRFKNHAGFTRMFKEDHLTIGLSIPLETYESVVPVMDMEEQIRLAKLADDLNFAALMVRDIPLHDPSFRDVGQMYDPWVYLGFLAAHTKNIALVTASVITSFQHPLNLAKSAASLDKISEGRLVFGLATGDRDVEFEAFQVDENNRSEYYREAFYVMKEIWKKEFPTIKTERVNMTGSTDLLPKPSVNDIPILVTSFSGQTLEWIAEHSDGWFGYSHSPEQQKRFTDEYRKRAGRFKPYAQILNIKLLNDPDAPSEPIMMGIKTGRNALIEQLNILKESGVNHVYLSLKLGDRPIDAMLEEIAEFVLPHFKTIEE
ncbi:LLM class oxidoreductase [Phocicoccus pinnipedialis]|uniref:Alkanesulfonate monooxygenase n=1 Tax=Phocicoccus pinnipedialis TaxID=110845 RepID=A0A6V7RAT9_9BACL|nr:LLM class oxidoreductase [Jeotgalicoccus pinnipedialis]MBP1940220.1 luciferase-type oxidoreductase [Jeotgalicoccus pinnipedialis]CAD2074084.1 Alkanesulfonate monooxygenase [Jeotgalicoccus pinnipedialis]